MMKYQSSPLSVSSLCVNVLDDQHVAMKVARKEEGLQSEYSRCVLGSAKPRGLKLTLETR
jgi:hypothetical protein